MFDLIENLFKKLQDKKWLKEDTETMPDIETTPAAPPRERPDKPINPVVPTPSTNPKPKATARDLALFVRNHNLAESVEEALKGKSEEDKANSVKAKFKHLAARLSPENLAADGERSPGEIKELEKEIQAEWRKLEKQYGQRVSEDDVWGWDTNESVTEAEAIHPDKQAWIKTGDEMVNQILPKVQGRRKTYLQTIAKESYNELVAKIQQYTGIELEDSTLPAVLQLVVQSVREVLQIEKQHTTYLEEWAVMLPLQLPEFKLIEDAHTAGSVKFDAKLASPDFAGKMNDAPAEGEEEGDELTPGEELNMALANELEGNTEQDIQRRFANMLISGGAGLKLYLYNLMSDRLAGINPRLPNLYGMMAAMAQLGYWVTPDGIEHGALEAAGAGMEEIEGDTEGVKTIRAVGICFPYLIHEVVKGIYEWLAMSGEQHADVSKRVDKLGDETHDLMVGGKVWQVVNSYVGQQEQEIMPLVQKEVIKLSPEQIQAVLAKDVEGKKIMDDIIVRSRAAWKTYQSQKEEYAKESADTLHQNLYLELNAGTSDLEESIASIARALKAGEITKEQHDSLVHADPSPGKTYVDWMKKIMLKDKIAPEALQSYFDGLHTFYILATNAHSPLQAADKSISAYRTMAEVNDKAEAAFNNLPEDAQGEMARNIRRKVVRKEVDRLPAQTRYQVPRNLNDTVTKDIGQRGKDGKIIKDTTSTVVQFENDRCIVVMPRTKEKSIKFGSFGGWCTAKPAGQNQFHTYWDTKDEALLYVIPKGRYASATNNWCIQMSPQNQPIKFWDFQDAPHEPNSVVAKAMMKRLGIEE